MELTVVGDLLIVLDRLKRVESVTMCSKHWIQGI